MKPILFYIAILCSCTLMGCAAAEPYDHDFEPDTNQSPGLFTGDKGELEILQK